jgi:hypothetical protein
MCSPPRKRSSRNGRNFSHDQRPYALEVATGVDCRSEPSPAWLANYFAFGYLSPAFRKMDCHLLQRLQQNLRRRSQRPYRLPDGRHGRLLSPVRAVIASPTLFPSGSLRMPAATPSGEPDAGNPPVRSMRGRPVVFCIAGRCTLLNFRSQGPRRRTQAGSVRQILARKGQTGRVNGPVTAGWTFFMGKVAGQVANLQADCQSAWRRDSPRLSRKLYCFAGSPYG